MTAASAAIDVNTSHGPTSGAVGKVVEQMVAQPDGVEADGLGGLRHRDQFGPRHEPFDLGKLDTDLARASHRHTLFSDGSNLGCGRRRCQRGAAERSKRASGSRRPRSHCVRVARQGSLPRSPSATGGDGGRGNDGGRGRPTTDDQPGADNCSSRDGEHQQDPEQRDGPRRDRDPCRGRARRSRQRRASNRQRQPPWRALPREPACESSSCSIIRIGEVAALATYPPPQRSMVREVRENRVSG